MGIAQRAGGIGLALVLLLAACGPDPGSPRPPADGRAGLSPASSSSGPALRVIPAPGSTSSVYAPNPAALVVAIDPGHGGCLDWGVPDPSQRGPALAEKTLTLGIATALATRLEEEGVHAVLVREGDTALAGDSYPPLDCHGLRWRDANGDGETGFGPGVPEATRTRDELQARIDVANLVRADVLVSIHIDAVVEGGTPVAIARTETFYTDETAWGADATARLAQLVQEGVVSALGGVADYERQDRGINAHNLYIVAPPLLEPTPERPDARRQPTRGLLMPGVLVEVGAITLPDEHELLASAADQAAVADGLFRALREYFAERALAARIDPVGAAPDDRPIAVPGSGPPFWAPTLDGLGPDGGSLALRVTNTGSQPWPAGARLSLGWQPTDGPYLAGAPADLAWLEPELPALAPGASVELRVVLRPPTERERHVAWVSVVVGGRPLAEVGSPALQGSAGQ